MCILIYLTVFYLYYYIQLIHQLVLLMLLFYSVYNYKLNVVIEIKINIIYLKQFG